MLMELIYENVNVFSRNDGDLGRFKATDGGPSCLTFESMDPSKLCYAAQRRVPYSRKEWLEQKFKVGATSE